MIKLARQDIFEKEKTVINKSISNPRNFTYFVLLTQVVLSPF